MTPVMPHLAVTDSAIYHPSVHHSDPSTCPAGLHPSIYPSSATQPAVCPSHHPSICRFDLFIHQSSHRLLAAHQLICCSSYKASGPPDLVSLCWFHSSIHPASNQEAPFINRFTDPSSIFSSTSKLLIPNPTIQHLFPHPSFLPSIYPFISHVVSTLLRDKNSCDNMVVCSCVIPVFTAQSQPAVLQRSRGFFYYYYFFPNQQCLCFPSL